MERKTQEKKGITLISLVITIILLLILGAVAINLAVDSDGLFRKAGQAANSWNESVADEQSTLQNLLDAADNIGKVTIVSEYITETSEVAGVEKERTAPIPAGYVASKATGENTIAGGLVIYQTSTEVNDTNHDDAVEDYNQYVWIPVDDINDMVMCSVCGGSVENLVYDDDAKTLACTSTHVEGTTPSLVGKLYTEGEYEETSITDAEGNQIGRIGYYDMNFEQDTQEFPEDYIGPREPDILEGDEATLLTQMQKDFNNMAKSVAKYGGFYISRYEIGENGVSKKGQTVLYNTEPTNWYTLQSTSRKTQISTTSQMIWGSQYDQVIKFIGEEAEVGHSNRNLSSEPALSGANPDDKMKNIYDLEGNYFEWTAAAHLGVTRIIRGGLALFVAQGFFVPASFIEAVQPDTDWDNAR